VVIVLAGAGLLLGAPAASNGRALAVQMVAGDLLVGGTNGTITHYSSTGVLKNTITVAATGFQTGMCVDSAWFVFTTNWSSSTVSKYTNGGMNRPGFHAGCVV
jgi:hypothetical protein